VGGLLADLHRGAREQAFTECGAVTYACAITANLATGVFAALAVGWRGALLFGAACGLALIFTFPGNAVPEASRPAVRASERLPPASWAYLVMLGFGVALEMTVGLPRTTAVTAAAAFPAAMLVGRTAGAVLVQRVRPEILHPSALCLIAPGFLAFWGGFSPLISVFGLFLAGLAIALLYPLSLSFAVGAAGAAGNSASARSGFAAGAAVLTVPVALGALADRVGLSLAYLAAPILASIVLLCFAAARLMEQQHARRIAKGLIGSSEGAEARRK
jgi:MFS family permease